MISKTIVMHDMDKLQAVTRKESGNMDTNLANYVDNEIIREHAYQHNDRYQCYVTDLTDYQKQNLLDRMFAFDEALKDILLDRMQELINERIDKVYLTDKYNAGLKPKIDQVNGEITWLPAANGDSHA